MRKEKKTGVAAVKAGKSALDPSNENPGAPLAFSGIVVTEVRRRLHMASCGRPL
jgi:hypothetical protein